VQVKAPDFVFPANEIKGKHSAGALTAWNCIKDKYQYAEKVNELSAKFGRIQPLVHELASLSEQFPHSASINLCIHPYRVKILVRLSFTLN
jgi:hypothetical protein